MTARPLPRLLSSVAILVLTAYLTGPHLLLGAQTPSRVDVIVQFTSAPGPADAAFVRGLGASIRYRYQVVPAMALSLPAQALPARRMLAWRSSSPTAKCSPTTRSWTTRGG
jgi:hypothetical protein